MLLWPFIHHFINNFVKSYLIICVYTLRPVGGDKTQFVFCNLYFLAALFRKCQGEQLNQQPVHSTVTPTVCWSNFFSSLLFCLATLSLTSCIQNILKNTLHNHS